jgi:hypothetical protein
MFKALQASRTGTTERGGLLTSVGRRRASFFWAGAAVLLGLLASCAGGERQHAAAVAVPIPPAVALSLPPPSAPVAVSVPIVPVAAPADMALPRLTGRTRADLSRLLGAPDFVRRDPPAEIWQYRSDECVLDLFLYPEAGEFQVVYAETRDRQTMRRAGSGCVAGLLRQQRLTTTASADGRL